jgi:hypothetical protein
MKEKEVQFMYKVKAYSAGQLLVTEEGVDYGEIIKVLEEKLKAGKFNLLGCSKDIVAEVLCGDVYVLDNDGCIDKMVHMANLKC